VEARTPWHSWARGKGGLNGFYTSKAQPYTRREGGGPNKLGDQTRNSEEADLRIKKMKVNKTKISPKKGETAWRVMQKEPKKKSKRRWPVVKKKGKKK